MSHHWLLITVSCFGTASLQYINTRGPDVETVLDPLGSVLNVPLPYTYYYNQPSNADSFQNVVQNDMLHDDVTAQRKRRAPDDIEPRNWQPNIADIDKTVYTKNDEIPAEFVIGYHEENNNTEVEKKNFSPWGGKRDPANFEHMWSWKRAVGIREPSMPKRVRFSPWGGKRSGQVFYKPGPKNSKIIFSTTIPDLARVLPNSPPSGQFNLARFLFIPGVDKRFPMKILTMTADMDEKTIRAALPFNNFLEPTHKMFKPGHPYNEVHLKKDGKRKMKFSIWGGKRSPPIIGPIWTPMQNLQKTALDVLLLRNNQETNDVIKRATKANN